MLVGAGRGRGVPSVCYWVVVPCCSCLRAVNGVRAGVCAWWCVRVGVCGERGCLGAGCVVRGGGLPVWLRDAVASGGASVGFDVGLRVFVLSGVDVPASGGVAASGPLGVGASGSSVSASGSGPVGVADGVQVCVPCAVRVFGDGWCSLVLRRWCAAAGVDVSVVDGLLGAGVVGGGSAASLRSASAGGGRVGAGFGARVRDWGACVGVGGGVVSGGGVVAGWRSRAVGRVRALASGVGVKGLVLLGLVGVVLLVSVLVLVG